MTLHHFVTILSLITLQGSVSTNIRWYEFLNNNVKHSSLKLYAKFDGNSRTTLNVIVKNGLLNSTQVLLFTVVMQCHQCQNNDNEPYRDKYLAFHLSISTWHCSSAIAMSKPLRCLPATGYCSDIKYTCDTGTHALQPLSTHFAASIFITWPFMNNNHWSAQYT